MRQTNPNFMNGVPELLVLRLLQTREMYGYELVQAIRDGSGAMINFGEGVVYPVLHQLERQGALRSRRINVGGRSRVYYALTPKGGERLADLTGSWSRLAEAIRAVLEGPRHAVPG
jgi:PadR family transcriptional regulator PadR